MNLAQIRTFTEMDSHEEKVYEAMRKVRSEGGGGGGSLGLGVTILVCLLVGLSVHISGKIKRYMYGTETSQWRQSLVSLCSPL